MPYIAAVPVDRASVHIATTDQLGVTAAAGPILAPGLPAIERRSHRCDQRMIPKSGYRFSEKIMLQLEVKAR
jgi:hypothetical protein